MAKARDSDALKIEATNLTAQVMRVQPAWPPAWKMAGIRGSTSRVAGTTHDRRQA